MKIQIRARGIKVTKALRADIKIRLGLVLGRFGGRIGPVVVHLASFDEPRERRKKRCWITVGFERPVEAQDTDVDLLAAVSRSADRVARSVGLAMYAEQMLAKSTSRARLAKGPLSRSASLLAATRKADTKRPLGLRRRHPRAAREHTSRKG